MRKTTTPHKALRRLQEILWPLLDPDRAWSADTMHDVAEVLQHAGYGPRPKPGGTE